ncbi:MAG TPA: hypothetical protein DEQ02_05485 [Ruminococcaceae bacterium]|nr:hypothetical protein [Oscillospiraceae bacterium]
MMGNNIKFRTEPNGYMKEQVDRYIETFAGAYRDLTQAYEQLREEYEKLKNAQPTEASEPNVELNQKIYELTHKNEELEKQNAALSSSVALGSEKDNIINRLKQENDSLQSRVSSLNDKLLEHKNDTTDSDMIAKVMIDAKLFARNVEDQAKQEAEMIRLKAEKEAKSIVVAKKRAVDDLKELQSMINDVIRCAELSYIGEKGDGLHLG